MLKITLLCCVLLRQVFTTDLLRGANLFRAPAKEVKQDLITASKDSVKDADDIPEAVNHASNDVINHDSEKQTGRGIHPSIKNKCLPEGLPSIDESAYLGCKDTLKEGLYTTHPNQFKSSRDILETYGYPYMEYKVATDDDYILTVFRITGSPKLNSTKAYGTPVYVNHGILGSSEWWFFLPPEKTLVFLMADQGYDVWISNARGTSYSLEHETLDHENLEYWDFSFHEMGIYDIPAVTDMILKETDQNSILYLGWSMGCTSLLICLSEFPEMNSKIRAAFFFGPAAFLGHSTNILRSVAFASEDRYQVLNSALKGRIRSSKDLRAMTKLTGSDVCALSAAKCGLCDNILFAAAGVNAPQLNRSVIPLIFGKMNSASIKSFVHYGQLMISCRFQNFDYSSSKNLKIYGSTSPPLYNLTNFRSPLYIYHGDQDNFLVPTDLREMLSHFRKGVVQKSVRVEDKHFNHLDFGIANDADTLLYNGLLSDMHKYVKIN